MTTTTVGHSPDSAKEKARRAERFHARHLLWDQSKITRIRSCGRQNRSPEGVAVRVTTSPDGSRTAGLSGVATCGSVWACPVCSAKIAAGRQADIYAAVQAWEARGGRVAFGTFTMRHNLGHRLRTLFDAVSHAWTSTTSGRGWVEDQSDFGSEFSRVVKTGRKAGQTAISWRIPTIRLWETTVGAESGWHVHVHALLFLPGDTTDARLSVLADSMYERWERSFDDGSMRPTREHGVEMHLLDGGKAAEAMGEYMTKNTYGSADPAKSASFEMARGDMKDARWGNRTPFAVLRGLVLATSGEVDPTGLDVEGDQGLWAEWEAASKGRRQVFWSPGLRAFLFPHDPEEATDQELAEAALDGDRVAMIPGQVFSQVTRHRADWQLVSAFQTSDRAGWAFLAPFFALAEAHESARDAAHGIRYRT